MSDLTEYYESKAMESSFGTDTSPIVCAILALMHQVRISSERAEEVLGTIAARII